MIPIAIGIALHIIPIIIGSGGRQFCASMPIGKQGNRQLPPLTRACRACFKRNFDNGTRDTRAPAGGGCGISIYNVETKIIQSILNEAENSSWIFALYQDTQDDMNVEFRFVTYFQNEKLRVHKMNIHSLKIEMLN